MTRKGKRLTEKDIVGKTNGSLICTALLSVEHKKNYWKYIIEAKCLNCNYTFITSWNSFRAKSRSNCKSCIHCMGKMMEEDRTKQTGFTKRERLKFAAIKHGAKRRKLDFELSEEDMKTLLYMPCKYCGKPQSYGIDRVDSKKGYTQDNVVPCCSICNKMKNNLSIDDFKSHINKIYKTLNENP